MFNLSELQSVSPAVLVGHDPVVTMGKGIGCGDPSCGFAISKRTHIPSRQHLPPQHTVSVPALFPARLPVLVLAFPEPRPGLGGNCSCLCCTGMWQVLVLCQAVLMVLPFAVKCLECKTVSDTYDPYLDVTLEVEVLLQGWGWWSLLLRGMFLL